MTAYRNYRITRHAIERAEARGISEDQIRAVLDGRTGYVETPNGNYPHQRRLQTFDFCVCVDLDRGTVPTVHFTGSNYKK